MERGREVGRERERRREREREKGKGKERGREREREGVPATPILDIIACNLHAHVEAAPKVEAKTLARAP